VKMMYKGRHGSADPDPHQNVMDPEHCATLLNSNKLGSATLLKDHFSF